MRSSSIVTASFQPGAKLAAVTVRSMRRLRLARAVPSS
jgi:hypothetical protein